MTNSEPTPEAEDKFKKDDPDPTKIESAEDQVEETSFDSGTKADSESDDIEDSSLSPDDPNYAQERWLKETYQGDNIPQLTVRAVLMGGFIGSLMSISNLYTTLKLGWSFGVAITACVLSFVIWRFIRLLSGNSLSQMSILENNCMQSTASAAGYSTGATIGTAFAALLLINNVHVSWQIVLPWTLVTAALGVFLAVPMKRQMINREQLPFPDGIAAAQTLRSLYGQSKEAITQAYALVSSLGIGAVVGMLSKGEWAWIRNLHLKLPELIPFGGKVSGVQLSQLPGFGFEPSVLLIGAGMIVGLRVSTSMLVGAVLLYVVIGPRIIETGDIKAPGELLRWALWTGTAIMVASGLTAFALQWRTIVSTFASVKKAAKSADKGTGEGAADPLKDIEVPAKWLVIGLIPLTILMVFIQWIAFNISPPLGLLSVVMSFLLALVACRATGETNITPIGAMGKITQLTYSVLAPSNITTNLMAASVTSNVASSSADLLTDLKSGYLLGANARKQFIAQFIGIFFGTIAVVPAWFMMIPDKAALDKFNPPAALMWKAVAEALAKGLDYIPHTAQIGILIGAAIGVTLAVIDYYTPPKYKKFVPSAMGLGLSWVVWFANCFSFFLGAIIAYIWGLVAKKNASIYVIPVASGAVAGESLMCAIIAMITAAGALGNH